MRALILIAGALVLAACSKNGQTDNTQNVDENLTAENIVSNDVTAIDAVTGDAANMAAESDVNDIGNIANAGSMSSPTKPVQRRAPPTGNSVSNGTAIENTLGATPSNSASNTAQ
ncbi:MAG TPA: hypothetical protein VGQ34_00855 [Sphingomicrobium sp.]|nr:hypothetical protein [Sphingomicrobium sp.]